MISDFKSPNPEEMKPGALELFSLRCPVCNFPLKYEYNQNYGIPLYICMNEPEICGFMTNDRVASKDIFKCPKCRDGYMVVRKNLKTSERFYGCTNYREGRGGCKQMMPLGKSGK